MYHRTFRTGDPGTAEPLVVWSVVQVAGTVVLTASPNFSFSGSITFTPTFVTAISPAGPQVLTFNGSGSPVTFTWTPTQTGTPNVTDSFVVTPSAAGAVLSPLGVLAVNFIATPVYTLAGATQVVGENWIRFTVQRTSTLTIPWVSNFRLTPTLGGVPFAYTDVAIGANLSGTPSVAINVTPAANGNVQEGSTVLGPIAYATITPLSGVFSYATTIPNLVFSSPSGGPIEGNPLIGEPMVLRVAASFAWNGTVRITRTAGTLLEPTGNYDLVFTTGGSATQSINVIPNTVGGQNLAAKWTFTAAVTVGSGNLSGSPLDIWWRSCRLTFAGPPANLYSSNITYQLKPEVNFTGTVRVIQNGKATTPANYTYTAWAGTSEEKTSDPLVPNTTANGTFNNIGDIVTATLTSGFPVFYGENASTAWEPIIFDFTDDNAGGSVTGAPISVRLVPRGANGYTGQITVTVTLPTSSVIDSPKTQSWSNQTATRIYTFVPSGAFGSTTYFTLTAAFNTGDGSNKCIFFPSNATVSTVAWNPTQIEVTQPSTSTAATILTNVKPLSVFTGIISVGWTKTGGGFVVTPAGPTALTFTASSTAQNATWNSSGTGGTLTGTGSIGTPASTVWGPPLFVINGQTTTWSDPGAAGSATTTVPANNTTSGNLVPVTIALGSTMTTTLRVTQVRTAGTGGGNTAGNTYTSDFVFTSGGPTTIVRYMAPWATGDWEYSTAYVSGTTPSPISSAQYCSVTVAGTPPEALGGVLVHFDATRNVTTNTDATPKVLTWASQGGTRDCVLVPQNSGVLLSYLAGGMSQGSRVRPSISGDASVYGGLLGPLWANGTTTPTSYSPGSDVGSIIGIFNTANGASVSGVIGNLLGMNAYDGGSPIDYYGGVAIQGKVLGMLGVPDLGIATAVVRCFSANADPTPGIIRRPSLIYVESSSGTLKLKTISGFADSGSAPVSTNAPGALYSNSAASGTSTYIDASHVSVFSFPAINQARIGFGDLAAACFFTRVLTDAEIKTAYTYYANRYAWTALV